MTARILVIDDEPDLEALVTHEFRRQIRDGSEATVDRSESEVSNGDHFETLQAGAATTALGQFTTSEPWGSTSAIVLPCTISGPAASGQNATSE